MRRSPLGSRPSSASAVVVLPQPDSPASPSASPRRSGKLTPSTIGTMRRILAVGDAQVAHVEQRVALDGRRAHARSRRVGLTISSSALPTRLNAIASSVTHSPGGMKYAHLPSVIAPES